MEVRKVRRSNQRSLEADKKVGMEEVYVCVCGGGSKRGDRLEGCSETPFVFFIWIVILFSDSKKKKKEAGMGGGDEQL